MQAQPSKQHCLVHQQRRRDPIQQQDNHNDKGKHVCILKGMVWFLTLSPLVIFVVLMVLLDQVACITLKCVDLNAWLKRKKKARAKMHDSLPSRTLEPMTTRNVIEAPKWIRNDEPACYETNKSPIGSTRSNGLSRSLGPHALHWSGMVYWPHMGNSSKESTCILVECKNLNNFMLLCWLLE